ncbi:helix-turn-helix domain-containing protein [Streptomyces sp. KL116D]|uniref:helix-turn-helix domain-containing protein n=1 Tax=Streptomyces sp. KL116D TaxID=3045152 RepID=UPI0035563FA4
MSPDLSTSDADEAKVTAGASDSAARRRLLVQDGIARAAIELFLEHGYDEVSVDHIAEAAGMSQRTLLPLFPRQDGVLRRYRHSLRQNC